MRRLFASAAALVLLAALVPSATANEPYRYAQHATSVRCYWIYTGTLWVWLDASIDDELGPSARFEGLVYDQASGGWRADLVSDPGAEPVVTADATSLTATIPLVDAAGTPAGVAELAASLEALGDVQVWDDRWHSGNSNGRQSYALQPYVVTGSLAVNGGSFDIGGSCYGDRTDAEVFQTQPDAWTYRTETHSSECTVTDGAATTHLAFDIGEEAFYTSFNTVVGSVATLAGGGGGTIVDGNGTAELTLWDPLTGNPVDGPGSVTISVARSGEPYSYTLLAGSLRETYSGELLDIDGQIVIEGGPTIPLDDCLGFNGHNKRIDTSPAGPTAGGPVPVNDLPSGAIELRHDGLAVAMTRGAAVEYEAPYPCEFDESGYETRIQHTVWYKFKGTGGSVTVDTAASDYDTAASAYILDATGALIDVPGACNEDIALEPFGFSWQARITFPTVAGTWYYIQIGGWPNWETSFGNLKVALR